MQNQMSKYFFLIGFAIIILPSTGISQSRNEIRAGRQEIRHNRRIIKRDVKEVEAFQDYLLEMKQCFDAQDQRAWDALTDDMLFAMHREIRQGEEAMEWHRRELQDSEAEVAEEQRELRHDRRDKQWTNDDRRDDRRDMRRDRRNLRDDRRDRRDDRRDLKNQQERTTEEAKIAQLFDKQRRTLPSNEAAYQQIANTAEDFLMMMKADAEANQHEQREDMKERREDRRERRDDRRESKEWRRG